MKIVEMKLYGHLCMLLSSASSNGISLLRRTRAVDKTYVVSLNFNAETYAELKNDSRESLPDAFTVCSTIMAAGKNWPILFNMLDNNGDQFLAPTLVTGAIEGGIQIGFRQRLTPWLVGKIPPLFPNEWTRSCIAVNTTSGLLQWVVDGILVLAE